MSTLTLDIKISTLNEIGNALDDLLDSAKSEVFRAEGAHGAVNSVLLSVSKLSEVIAVDLQAGRISPEHAEIARLWVSRATQIVDNLFRNHTNSLFLARGAEAQNARLVKAVKTMYDLEYARKERILSPPPPEEIQKPEEKPAEAPAAPPPPVVPEVAVRKSPAPRTIKERRLAAEQQPSVGADKQKRAGRAKKLGA